MNLGKNVKITTCLDYAAGSAVRYGASIDMKGYDGVMAIMHCATFAGSAAGDIHFETATADFSGETALLGTAIVTADSDSDEIFVADLYKPLERYIRAVVTKNAAQTSAESVLYIRYKGVKRPEVNTVDSLVTYELNISPIRGAK